MTITVQIKYGENLNEEPMSAVARTAIHGCETEEDGRMRNRVIEVGGEAKSLKPRGRTE